jgi:hypothetical protein
LKAFFMPQPFVLNRRVREGKSKSGERKVAKRRFVPNISKNQIPLPIPIHRRRISQPAPMVLSADRRMGVPPVARKNPVAANPY